MNYKQNNIPGLLIIALVYLFQGCSQEPVEMIEKDYLIDLEWYENYPNERRVDVDSGLIWTLAYLGADLRTGTYVSAFNWKSESIVQFDLTQSGFNNRAQKHVAQLIRILKESGEYKVNGTIDIGRFVSIMLLSSPHYYAITGVPEKLEDYLEGKKFQSRKTLISESTISISNRMIDMPQQNGNINEVAFVAEEGFLVEDSSEFTTHEFEVLDFMENGLPRFAIYDKEGNLQSSADNRYSLGGKPSKCLWCHESILNPSFVEFDSVDGFQSRREFNNQVVDWNNRLEQYRLESNQEINLFNSKQHQLAELLYVGFMQPSLHRLSQEWGVDASTIESWLVELDRFDNDEHSFMVDRYNRNEVELISPYSTLMLSQKMRESGGMEVDYTN